MEQVTIAGVVYNVVEGKSPAQLRAANMPNVAKFLEEQSVARQLIVKRPKGSRYYYTREREVRTLGGTLIGKAYQDPVSIMRI